MNIPPILQPLLICSHFWLLDGRYCAQDISFIEPIKTDTEGMLPNNVASSMLILTIKVDFYDIDTSNCKEIGIDSWIPFEKSLEDLVTQIISARA